MTAVTLPDSRPAPTSSGDDADHYYCCDPDIAMCGADLTAVVENPDMPLEDVCRYCLYIDDEDLPCPVEGCAA
jgi:hypothetical protein